MEKQFKSSLGLFGLVMLVVLVECLFFLILSDEVYRKVVMFFLCLSKPTQEIIFNINSVILPIIAFIILFFVLLGITANKLHHDLPESPTILFLFNLLLFNFILSAGIRYINSYIELIQDAFNCMGQRLPALTNNLLNLLYPFLKYPFLTLLFSMLFTNYLFFELNNDGSFLKKVIFQLIFFICQLILFGCIGLILYLPMYSLAGCW